MTKPTHIDPHLKDVVEWAAKKDEYGTIGALIKEFVAEKRPEFRVWLETKRANLKPADILPFPSSRLVDS